MNDITLFFSPTLHIMPTYLLTVDGFRTQNGLAVEVGVRRILCSDRTLAAPLLDVAHGVVESTVLTREDAR